MATLPSMTRQLEDDFVNTWYEIKSTVQDNILEATILLLALKDSGCMKPQQGGEFGWTDTIGYGTKSTQRFQKGSTLTQDAPKIDTFARLDWRYFCIDITRSLVDDKKNMGKFKIKSYLQRRIENARDSMSQDLETYLHQWGAYYPAPKQINGIFDIVAPQTAETTSGGGSDSDTYASGTSNGNINRTNTWWRNWVMYDNATANSTNKIAGATNEPYDLNLRSDLAHMYNSVSNNQEPPNLILTSQDIYEAYEDEVSDKQQIAQNAFTKKAIDLGFVAFTFKGATMSYSSKITGNHVLLLNTNRIDWNYHPDCWFDMTDWKDTPNQFERVAYIVCMTPGLATNEPRRHGIMTYAS